MEGIESRSSPSSMSNSERVKSADWHAQENFLLTEIFRLIGKSLSSDEVFNEILHLLSELLGLNRGRIVLRGLGPDDKNTSGIAFAYGMTAEEIKRGTYQEGEGVTGAVLKTGQAMVVQDIDSEPVFLGRSVHRGDLPQETVAFLAFPIRVDERVVGVIAAHRIRTRNRSLSDDIQILKSISTLIGQILKLENFIREKTEKLEAKNQLLQHALEQSTAKYGIIGNSEKLLRALSDLEKVASSSAKVLLLGESGTGKELFARAIHLSSSRKSQPFIKINCSAIPDTLFEAELFGYEKGAFTGASSSTPGWFEKADKGTIFLDEIGELPIQMQAKLLRTLQEQTVVRLGGKSEIKVDFRLVSATNQDLQEAIHLGRFREDLFYRINTVSIPLPSLSERRDDIEPLVIYFLNKANQAHQKNCRLTPVAIQRLQEYDWPGNIRELSNLIERLVILVGDDLIDELEVKKFLSEPRRDVERAVAKHFDGFGIREYSHTYESNPAELLEALKSHHWNQSRASQALGMTTRQLSYRLKKLGIDIPTKK